MNYMLYIIYNIFNIISYTLSFILFMLYGMYNVVHNMTCTYYILYIEYYILYRCACTQSEARLFQIWRKLASSNPQFLQMRKDICRNRGLHAW